MESKKGGILRRQETQRKEARHIDLNQNDKPENAAKHYLKALEICDPETELMELME